MHMMKQTKICELCKKEYSPSHHNQKYCGKYYIENNCSWIAKVLHNKFVSIKGRCLDENHENYKYYKNVKICKEWITNSQKFVLWAYKNGWKNGLQIDRINNDRGYYPNNCRFVTRSDNCRNKKYKATDWINKTRKCRICQKTKLFCEFMISRKEVGGIAYECKMCRKEIDRKRWAKNK